MSVVLLSNVGVQDVHLDGEMISPARSKGEGLLRTFGSHADRLSLPMLLPAVEHLLRGHAGEAVDVSLYGTDQREGTKHHANDTVHFAELAKRLLDAWRPKGLGAVRVKAIREANPSLYDDMLAFFREQLAPRQGWVRGVETCYVFVVGGVPAANTGLMLAAMERFEDRCRTLYLPKGQTRVVEMDLGDQMRRAVLRRQAVERLGDLSFAAAAPLMERARAPRWMALVARYAADPLIRRLFSPTWLAEPRSG